MATGKDEPKAEDAPKAEKSTVLRVAYPYHVHNFASTATPEVTVTADGTEVPASAVKNLITEAAASGVVLEQVGE
jgi:hypothetical protein